MQAEVSYLQKDTAARVKNRKNCTETALEAASRRIALHRGSKQRQIQEQSRPVKADNPTNQHPDDRSLPPITATALPLRAPTETGPLEPYWPYL